MSTGERTHDPGLAQTKAASAVTADLKEAEASQARSQLRHRIFYDGLNLAVPQGTGIATYTRVLARVTREIGYQIGVVYSTPQTPPKAKLAREIAFFDTPRAAVRPTFQSRLEDAAESIPYRYWVRPTRIDLSGTVITRGLSTPLPSHDEVYAARNLFAKARRHFARTGKFVNLAFDVRPDIFHCTYQMPLQIRNACGVFTIHDLVPLRLPFTTLDNKRYMLRLLRKIASTADHIVTVSEHSKRDIVKILGVSEKRVTNTYQTVILPHQYEQISEAEIANLLSGVYGLDLYRYFLFFGAFEPKKNIGRIIDAYMMSNVDVPLLIVGGDGWQTESEQKILTQLQETQRSQLGARRRIYRLNYVSSSTLLALVRGALSVVFPSLYEGFGLPILESMALGTPVITSTESSMPEIAGDAALLVDPYDSRVISQAMNTIYADAGLREELSRRGKLQATKFSLQSYRERIERLYTSLL